VIKEKARRRTMEIKVLQHIKGAKKAIGLVVIIDVFRAFTVACYLMENGAAEVIPVGEKDVAYEMKEKNQEYILIGERNGKMLEGFDYGNSPSQIEKVDFAGKTVVHTTSAGTQGLANAIHGQEVLTGSLVNARAIVKYIQEKQPKRVSLVCMGWNGREEAQEDNLCASYIKNLLEGNEMDIAIEIESLKKNSGAKFFDKEQNEVFPERDFYLCTAVNQFDFVLRLEREKNKSSYLKKIIVSSK